MAGNKKSKVKKKKMMGGKKTKVMKLRGGMKTKVKKMAVGRTPPVKKTRRTGGGNMGIVGGRDYMPKPPKDLVRKPIRGQKVRPAKPKTRKDSMGRSMLARGGISAPPRGTRPIQVGGPVLPVKPPKRSPLPPSGRVRPVKPKGKKDAMGRNKMAIGGVGKMRKGMKAGKVVSFQDYVKSMFGGGKT